MNEVVKMLNFSDKASMATRSSHVWIFQDVTILAVSLIAIFDRLKTEISKKICWHWTKTSITTRMHNW